MIFSSFIWAARWQDQKFGTLAQQWHRSVWVYSNLDVIFSWLNRDCLGPKLSSECTNSNQTGWKPRIIWVFPGHIIPHCRVCHCVALLLNTSKDTFVFVFYANFCHAPSVFWAFSPRMIFRWFSYSCFSFNCAFKVSLNLDL